MAEAGTPRIRDTGLPETEREEEGEEGVWRYRVYTGAVELTSERQSMQPTFLAGCLFVAAAAAAETRPVLSPRRRSVNPQVQEAAALARLKQANRAVVDAARASGKARQRLTEARREVQQARDDLERGQREEAAAISRSGQYEELLARYEAKLFRKRLIILGCLFGFTVSERPDASSRGLANLVNVVLSQHSHAPMLQRGTLWNPLPSRRACRASPRCLKWAPPRSARPLDSPIPHPVPAALYLDLSS